MIIQINNKSKNFYAHLGQVFGSREVERITSDRIYDDEDKVWFLYYKRGVPDTFVSIKDDAIKNVWTYDEKHLIEVLKEIRKKVSVKDSIVAKYFSDAYTKAGFKILDEKGKNFLVIRGDEIEKD